MAGRSRIPESAHRPHRQHASHRGVYRQAVPAGLGVGIAARAGRAARVRDAAARADEPDGATADRRALVATFWRTPYKQKLVHWGSSLHERFMFSPHFVPLGLGRRSRGFGKSGLRFSNQERFGAPFRISISSIAGRSDRRGIHLELRHALEPWNVLGEETPVGATVRNVDFGRERLQVSVTDSSIRASACLCNGRRVPLHPGG